MPDSASEDVLDKALAAMPFAVEEIVSEDISNQRTPKITGYASTPQGRRAFAATLSNRGASRRLVVLFDEPAKIDKLLRRVGSVSNFRSNIAGADRPGWVPGQNAAAPSRTARTQANSRPAKTAKRSNTQQAAPQQTARKRGNYALPTDQSDFNKWPLTGKITRSPNASDPLAPRGYVGVTGLKYNVRSFDGALRDLVETAGITVAGAPSFQRLESWTSFDGRQSRMVMVPTVRQGEKGVLMAYLVLPKGSSDYSILAYEVPEQTFLDGGGIIRMMMLRDIIPSASVFPAKEQRRIARSPFKQQLKLYNAVLGKLYERKSRQFIASQSAVTLRMMELNYDLLLGGDISSPFIAD